MFDQLITVLPDTAAAPGGRLHIGGVDCAELANAYGTPVIVYDQAHVQRAARAWIDAFAQHAAGTTVAYATKAFSAIAMLRLLGELGLGADVSSLGELRAARLAGIDPARIVVHGNNKSRAELTAAVEARVGLIVVDARSELDLLEDVLRTSGATPQAILVRINPDIEVETHQYINTAHAGSKFGVPAAEAAQLLARADQSSVLEARGVHVHLGSQLLDTAPWRRMLSWLADWAFDLRAATGIELRTLDVGGGLGIAYTELQRPPTPAEVAHVVQEALADFWVARGLRLPHLIVEPGRSIVGQAALTLYRVGVVKDAGGIRYVNVDGGMSDNPRPGLYGAEYRALLAERCHEPASGPWWVAGVHRESGDVLVEDAQLPTPVRGELLAIPATGAYAVSMASTYNLTPRCAVALVDNGAHRLLLRRERLDELFARDVSDSEPLMSLQDAVDWTTDHILRSNPDLSRAVIAAAAGAAALAFDGEDGDVAPDALFHRTLGALGRRRLDGDPPA